MREFIYELRVYEDDSHASMIRIFTELNDAMEMKDKLLEKATEYKGEIVVVLLPFMKDGKEYKPFIRGMKDYNNFNQLNK